MHSEIAKVNAAMTKPEMSQSSLGRGQSTLGHEEAALCYATEGDLKNKAKSSASLPIGSYEWAVARLAEVGADAYAINIKLERDVRDKPISKKHKKKVWKNGINRFFE